MPKFPAPDLTRQSPRSARVRLGGFVHLPRLLDKARALVAGTQGEYCYNCPLDKLFFDFTGIGHRTFLAAVKRGRSDTEMLTWVNARTKRTQAEVIQWSSWVENRGPGSAEAHGHFQKAIAQLAPGRSDITTFFERLDLDDYVTFGGRP